tara:strand:+ start:436 stop:585 length:150 start_codon:yes stop_codon:yes gene_type:complete
LKNINLLIFKGDIVGIIVTTGNGKTSFLDVVMGILEPDNGKIFIYNSAL